jgi:type IV pilus assembly protein PilA
MRKARGFTLVELMIVVAIIGILASLAIYGVRKYTTNAKTGEVKMVVARIAKDASGAFNRQNMLVTGILADDAVAGSSSTLCGKAAATIPAAAASIKGQKYQSKAADWDATTATVGWRCLKSSLSEPQYFMYNYIAADAPSGANGATFNAVGQGDLDADDTLSTFQVDGIIRNGAVVVSPTFTETNPDE